MRQCQFHDIWEYELTGCMGGTEPPKFRQQIKSEAVMGGLEPHELSSCGMRALSYAPSLTTMLIHSPERRWNGFARYWR